MSKNKAVAGKPELMTNLLRYHAVPGMKLDADKIQNDMTVKTMAGSRLKLRFNIYGKVYKFAAIE